MTTSRIRDTLRRVLNLPTNTIMEYKTHNDSLRYQYYYYCNTAVDPVRTSQKHVHRGPRTVQWCLLLSSVHLTDDHCDVLWNSTDWSALSPVS